VIIDNFEGGISLDTDANYNYLYRNVITNNQWEGIVLGQWSYHNIITHNMITSNNKYGIALGDSDNNTIVGNTIAHHDRGIGISEYYVCYDNHIYHNNFINNSEYHAYDRNLWNNTWDNGYPSGGNYWDDFDEPNEGAWDNNSDGIVDAPYNITGGDNQDRYPLLTLFICGDANGDKVIDVGDVVYLINYLYRNGPAPIPMDIGDVNNDKVIDIGDIVYLINYLFKGGPAPG